ncbi:hypothetical protein ILYODFUR_007277 [Ilyodon furcidens]|uniref:Uncharacterized protein n=1 Tax=Ilyodon furcidens TaxID=33524 RepID=A0ABV0TSP2_9TELE
MGFTGEIQDGTEEESQVPIEGSNILSDVMKMVVLLLLLRWWSFQGGGHRQKCHHCCWWNKKHVKCFLHFIPKTSWKREEDTIQGR